MKCNYEPLTEKDFAPLLKTGDRFIAETKLAGEVEYEFVGFYLDTNRSTGCDYLVLKNVETGGCVGVERLWFDTYLTGRKITMLKRED